MGRSFTSVRQGVKGTANRWARSARSLTSEDREAGEDLARLAKVHSSEAFCACDDPFEAAVFSALIELLKRQGRAAERTGEGTCNVDL